MLSMKDALVIENLSVRFGRHQVLRDVSARFPACGVSVLLGRSGSGKTTLLRAVNRLNEELPGCVTSGKVLAKFSDRGDGLVDIYQSAGLRLRELRLRAGMLFQTPNLFPLSVYRNLSLPLQLVRGYDQSELDGRIRVALEKVGLWKEIEHKLDIPAEQLSGGQQQRLCLARTLSLEPDLLLLDEPTASLDVHAAEVIEKVLRELAEKYPVIMVSHSLAQARRMGRRIYILEDGRISGRLDAGDDMSEELLAKLL